MKHETPVSSSQNKELITDKENKRIGKNYDIACSRQLGITVGTYRRTYKPKDVVFKVDTTGATRKDVEDFLAMDDEDIIKELQVYIVSVQSKRVSEFFNKTEPLTVIDGGKNK